MVRMIRRDGGVCWVHESRLEEYIAAGCRLPDPPEAKKKRVSRPGTRTKTERK